MKILAKKKKKEREKSSIESLSTNFMLREESSSIPGEI